MNEYRPYKTAHTKQLDAIGHFLADAPVNLKVTRVAGQVQITLDGTVYSVKVSHKA